MKKLLALVAMTVISVSALFAENTFHIGAYIPISPWTLDVDGHSVDYSNNGFGGFFDYTHVADGGFVWKVNTGYASVSSSDIDDLTGGEFDLGFGFGGSPIHDSKMTLSITGNFGLRVQTLSCSESYTHREYDYYYSKYVTKTETLDTDFFDFMFYIGPEISFTYRFHEHVGVFANMGIFYSTGWYDIDADYRSDDSSSGSVSGFTFEPKFGIAFTL